MGLLANAVRSLVPQRKMAVAAAVQTWDVGREQTPPFSYDRSAREGYILDEIVFECVELRANSAGEPMLCAYRPGDDEKLDEHNALKLLNRPNRFMGRSRFWATVSMCQDIGGNAYVEKVRSAAGKVVELWPLRPDRMTVIPSATEFIGGYNYRIGSDDYFMAASDVIHFKTRHPLNDFYGLSPLAVLAGRVDLDVWQRRFMTAFFRNAGVPSGLLNIKRTMNEQERKDTRRSFREEFGGGMEGWFQPLVIDSDVATYTPMGLPIGSNGLAMPEGNMINETRICGVYGVPTSLIPTMAGSMANRGQTAAVSERDMFWEQTMIPWFRDQDNTLTMGLADDFPDLDRIEHDLSTVRALQEDEDKKHTRYREDFKAGLLTFTEARAKLGESPEPDEAGIVLVPSTMVPTWSDEMLTEPEPLEPALPAPGAPQPAPANGRVNGVAAGAR